MGLPGGDGSEAKNEKNENIFGTQPKKNRPGLDGSRALGWGARGDGAL